MSTTAPQVVNVLVPPSPAALGIPVSKSLADTLRTIRILESNETYTIPKNRGGASGAYQYIDSTWNNYMGYPSAYLAPPEIQDQKAALDVTAILSTWGGDVSMVPVIWYYPKAAYDPTLMDLVPMPGAGNSLTVREYQTRWLRIYSQVTGTEVVTAAPAPVHTASTTGEPPVLQRNWGPFLQIAYPLLGPSSVEPTVCDSTDPAANAVGVSTSACAPAGAVIINGQFHQPVVAVADGIISNITGEVVTADPAAPASTVKPADGPVGLTLVDTDGRHYIYSGFNDGSDPNVPQFSPLVKIGGRVRAGQVLGYLGGNDADRRVTPAAPTDPAADPATVDTVAPLSPTANPPQLRLQITSALGQPIDAEGLAYAASVRQACDVAVGPWSAVDLSTDRAGITTPSTPESGRLPTVVPVIGGSGKDHWFIAPNGALSAQGLAAMIVAPTGCSLVPTQLFGPGAEGSESPTTWTADIDVSAKYVVNAVSEQTRAESPGVAPKMRR